jgi:hypothetical protein
MNDHRLPRNLPKLPLETHRKIPKNRIGYDMTWQDIALSSWCWINLEWICVDPWSSLRSRRYLMRILCSMDIENVRKTFRNCCLRAISSQTRIGLWIFISHWLPFETYITALELKCKQFPKCPYSTLIEHPVSFVCEEIRFKRKDDPCFALGLGLTDEVLASLVLIEAAKSLNETSTAEIGLSTIWGAHERWRFQKREILSKI